MRINQVLPWGGREQLALGIVYIISDLLLSLSRDAPAWGDDREVMYTILGYLSILGLASAINMFSLMWDIQGKWRLLCCAAFIYIAARCFMNTFWFLIIFTGFGIE